LRSTDEAPGAGRFPSKPAYKVPVEACTSDSQQVADSALRRDKEPCRCQPHGETFVLGQAFGVAFVAWRVAAIAELPAWAGVLATLAAVPVTYIALAWAA
jgi:hypothetical protein